MNAKGSYRGWIVGRLFPEVGGRCEATVYGHRQCHNGANYPEIDSEGRFLRGWCYAHHPNRAAAIRGCHEARAVFSAGPDLLAAIARYAEYHGPTCDEHIDHTEPGCEPCAIDAALNAACAKAEGRAVRS